MITTRVNFETFGDSFLPLKISFSIFYTLNTQNLKEFTKGKTYSLKVFLEINIARFARKNETFLAVFKHYVTGQM